MNFLIDKNTACHQLYPKKYFKTQPDPTQHLATRPISTTYITFSPQSQHHSTIVILVFPISSKIPHFKDENAYNKHVLRIPSTHHDDLSFV